MTTANKIRDVGLYFFSQHGYEGTSLSQIAAEVGVKTPSLYAHFKSKENIFFTCLDYASKKDLEFFEAHINSFKSLPVQEVLYRILDNYKEHVENNIASEFCIRTLYFPPYIFRETMIQKAIEHISNLGLLLKPLFEKAKENGDLTSIEIEDAIEAYLCLFDGLMIELVYSGSSKFQYRLKASWPVFKKGLLN